jgi:hypothetical protein
VRRVIERRYGFGAARVVLHAAPLRRRGTPSLAHGWQAAMREEGDEIREGVRRAVTRGALPTLAMIAVSLILGALMREQVDDSATTLVPFEEPPIALEEPAPEPEIVPEPEVIPEPEPEPEPEVIAKAEPPPAIVEPPKPAPPPPPRAPAPEPPKRTPPRIDPVAAPVVARATPPAPPPPTRPAVAPPPKRSAPPLAFAAEALQGERAPEPAPTRRATPFQTARPSDARVRPALGALDVPLDAPEPTTPARSQRVASVPARRSHSAPPLDFAAAAPPAAPGEQPRRDSSARRPVTATPPRRRERGNPVDLAVPAAPARDPVPTRSASAPRAARPVAPAAGTRREAEPGLRGVPLASLAACRSDRQEDALKQRVVAAAEDRGRCESAAGRFHFVETKNVNAFLMRIERAPGRQLGDRCSELLHALDCLAKAR